MKKILTLFASFALVFTTAFSAEAPAFTVKVSGHGQPMILIPGLTCPGEVWDTTVEHFKDRYECHVFSLAGFGGTPAHSTDAPFLASSRDAIVSYIRIHKLDHPVIVGHSLGGFLALDLAAKNPSLAGPLVIVDSIPFLTGVMRPGTTPDQARAGAADMRRYFDSMDNAAYEQSIRAGTNTRGMVASDEDHARIVAWSLASDRATVASAMTELFSADLRADLARIQSPTLVFASWIAYKPYTDHARIEATYREQYASLPHLKLVVSDTAHHFIMFDDPQWLFAQMDSFLSAQSPASN